MANEQIRHDGFTGQHLFVLPKPVRDAAGRHPLLRPLLVTDAGYYPNASGHHVERPKGAPTHLLIVCLKGAGWARSDVTQHEVKPGDVIWLRAEKPHAYGADSDDPWTIAWVHFSGDEAEYWRSYIGFDDDPVSRLSGIHEDGQSALAIEQIYLSLEKGSSHPDLISAAVMLRQTLNQIASAVRWGRDERSVAQRVMEVREHLRKNLEYSHRLDELATAAGLSVSHFSSIFRRQTGYAPIDFLIRQRMLHACQLLVSSDISISKAAAAVGYDDAYYFSRCFRKIMGVSPRAYRKLPKG